MADLDERFRSFSRVTAPDLWDEAHDRIPRPLPRAPRGSQVLTVVVAFAVALAGIGAGIVVLRRMASERHPAAASSEGRIAFVAPDGETWQAYVVNPDGTGLTQLTYVSPPDVVDEVVWSPDGTRFAYVVRPSDTDRSDIWVSDADGANAHPLGLDPGAREPSWSPDASEIAYTTSNGQIWIVGADGTRPPHPFTNCGPPECVADSSPAWSTDGSSIAFVRQSGADPVVPFSIFVWPVEGGRPAPTYVALEGATWARELAWSPDGSRLAFTRSVDDGARFAMFVADVDGSRVERLAAPPTAQSPAWSPDGERIAFMAFAEGTEQESLFVMDSEGSGVRAIPGLPPEASWPSWGPPPPTEEPVPPGNLAENGRIAYVSNGQLLTITPDGGDAHRIGVADRVGGVSWSPDGRRLAFDLADGEEGFCGCDLFVANADGSDVVRLTSDGTSRLPAWSPDGSEIAYTSQPSGGTSQIFVMDADGSDAHQVTTGNGFSVRPSWSPDGSRIAFESVVDRNPDVYVMNADGTGVRRLTSDAAADGTPVWSPDGTEIAFTSSRGPNGVYLMGADGTDPRLVVPDDDVDNLYVAWSPDGTKLALASDRGEGFERAIYVFDLASGELTQLTDRGPIWGPAWQPAPVDATPTPSPMAVQTSVTLIRGVAEFPTAIAVGDGGVWVTAQDQDGSGEGELIRIDPVTAEVVARTHVRAAPGWEFGGAGLTVADGNVWVVGEVRASDERCCAAFVSRVDAATNALVDEIEVPSEGSDFGNDVWADGDSLYVLMFVDGANALELAKLDVATHAVDWRVPVPGQWSQTVFTAGGSVWVLGTAPDAHGPIEVDMLYRLDPADGSLVDQLPLDASLYAPVVEGGGLWLRGAEGAQRMDATSGSLVGGPVRPAPGCCTGAFVGDGIGGVWVLSSPGAGVERSIWHIDSSGQVVASGAIEDHDAFQQMGGQSYAFDPATQTIWVQHYQDSVAAVRIATP
jgi:Tol biopolymer transport system component